MTAVRAVVITASDACARGEREDTSGATLVQLLTELGAEIVATEILSDDLDPLVQSLTDFADRDDVNLIITTGGTFLFSSRRRHTRCLSDWSSDVCSSDLSAAVMRAPRPCRPAARAPAAA